ncbi:MAG: hypothetical protein RLZ72_251 [Actinomycetota bacterium]|jgi:hypothetical protein
MVNSNVVTFFVLGTIALGFVGFRFLTSSGVLFRRFGIGLALYALAFAVWSVIVATQPADLQLWTTLGVLPFGVAHLFHVSAATFDWKQSNRLIALGSASTFLAVLFVLRTWVFPSTPGFSDGGLFYFNADPVVTLLYILVFAGAFMPALHVVSSHIGTRWLAALTRIGFNLVVLGAVVLLASYDDNMQYVNGFIMGGGFLGLAVSYLIARPTPSAR